MNWREFFHAHGEWCVSGGTLTVEELYQAFRDRMLDEIIVREGGAHSPRTAGLFLRKEFRDERYAELQASRETHGDNEMTSVNAELHHREQDQKCQCVRCGTCNGDGTIYDPFDYIGDELITCEDCGGSGITEECDRCMDRREQDRDESREGASND